MFSHVQQLQQFFFFYVYLEVTGDQMKLTDVKRKCIFLGSNTVWKQSGYKSQQNITKSSRF